VEFRLLGPVAVRRDGEPLALGGPRQRAVLAALALRRNEVVSVDQLTSAVWERTPVSPASNIRTYVRQLRRVLGDRLATRTPGYQLTVGEGELDVAVFEELADRGVKALNRDDLTAGMAYLDRALHLWRGAPLEGLAPGSALVVEAVRLAERRMTVVEQLVNARISLGQYAEAVAQLRRLIVDNPLRERLWARLMDALYRSGRRAEALDAYQQVRRLLVDELGVEPGQELRQTHRAIVTDAPERADRPAALPERPAALPQRPAAVPQRPHRPLPADIVEFTGRSAELRRLHDLARSDVVCGIVGAPGSGKTRLAVRAAHQLTAGDLFDAFLYADLAGFTAGREPVPAETVLDQFLADLGVAADQIPSDVDDRSALYRDRLAHRRTLLVLDNAADCDQVRPLLPGGPGCFVLVTSRRSLAWLDGVHMVRLDMFRPEEAVALLGRLAGEDRVTADPAAARQVVELCGRLPAAVAVAARRLETRTAWALADLRARLGPAGHRLTELTAGPQDIRAMFQLSYQGLPADQRRMFRLLALHPGPDATAASAAALADIGTEYADLLLESLLDEHLVRQTTQGRYRLHELLRLYARERCDVDETAGERAAAVRRVLDWYLHTAAGAGRLMDPRALGWFAAERANLLAAVCAAADHGLDGTASRLPEAMHGFLRRDRDPRDWVTTNQIAIGAAERLGDRRVLANCLDRLGEAHYHSGQYVEALGCHQQALEVRRGIADQYGQANTLYWLGAAYQGLDRPEDAVRCLRIALLLYRINLDRPGERSALARLGAEGPGAGRGWPRPRPPPPRRAARCPRRAAQAAPRRAAARRRAPRRAAAPRMPPPPGPPRRR
jgi:DNA-binding SARP family transcriptional activator